MLTTATVHSDLRCAAAIYADTNAFTLSALSPARLLWDAIPRDIDTIRHQPTTEIRGYCQQLADDAQMFSSQIRDLMVDRKLIVLDQIKTEVQGQKGRTQGLRGRADQRFPFAPPDLVRKSLSFQMAAHDHGLAAQQPQVERQLVVDIMHRLGSFWHDERARFGEQGESVNDKLLFATAAANAIMIENGAANYGIVVLVSRDFNHVFRMYRKREELLRPICKKNKFLFPRNFLFHPTFQDIRTAMNEPTRYPKTH